MVRFRPQFVVFTEKGRAEKVTSIAQSKAGKRGREGGDVRLLSPQNIMYHHVTVLCFACGVFFFNLAVCLQDYVRGSCLGLAPNEMDITTLVLGKGRGAY